MKTVFSTSEIFHVFAERSQTEGRASSLFFYGDKIYSFGYHYLLAEFITNTAGDIAIMINDSGYSVTTSKHISRVTSATRQYKQFFTEGTDAEKVAYSLNDLFKKLGRAKKPEIYLIQIEALLNSYEELKTWMQAAKDKFPTDKKKQAIKDIAKFKKMFEAGKSGDLAAKMLDAAKKKAAAEIKAEKKATAEKLKNFLEFKSDWFRAGEQDFCRINTAAGMVETSQGVKIEAKQAATLYKMIKAGKDIKGVKIGEHNQYTVISLNGVLTIGCHKINRANMEQTGEQLLKLGY